MTTPHDFTGSVAGILALTVLVGAYYLVFREEKLHLRKSIPVLLGAGIIWIIIGISVYGTEHARSASTHLEHNLTEYGQILMFLLVAMCFINILEEMHVFDALRGRLEQSGQSARINFWLTGLLAFIISPFADNMTTALLMGTVVIKVGKKDTSFIAPACVNIVVAANAGGAFSPFGDITTLMVWQAEKVPFATFFYLFLPALVTWLVPAALMARKIPNKPAPAISHHHVIHMRRGAWWVIGCGIVTITASVLAHQLFHFSPVLGMMFGLGVVKGIGYLSNKKSTDAPPFEVLKALGRVEWDTLLFFYGIIIAVGGIGYLGYLSLLSGIAYESWGGLPRELCITIANTGVGIVSAVIDNIPIVFAVLSMNPEMSQGQWLLVTLTAGVGGSMLSIGSAAGVALMGIANDKHGETTINHYTFRSHLQYGGWQVPLGYAAGIGTHLVVNASLF